MGELFAACGLIFLIACIFIAYYAGVAAGKKYGSNNNDRTEENERS